MSMMSRNALLCTSAIVCMAVAAPAHAQTKSFDIPAQSVESAIGALGRQADVQIVGLSKAMRGKRSNAVRGDMTVQEALTRLLAGTGLTARQTASRTFSVVPSEGQSQGNESTGDVAGDDRSAGATPDILVVGSRTVNVDIKRTEDDAQPYVVFDRKEIENSQASNLNDFFRTRLPMNTVQASAAQNMPIRTSAATGSEINLRGLGSNQTLILVDGRRMPGFNAVNLGVIQADINGIPLTAIERIEVLPTTAGGIYGGSATGGVINIITKRDYSGLDANATYGNTFRGDYGEYRLDASAGFNLEGGKTHVMISGSYSGAGNLEASKRDFLARARALQFANDPASFATLTVPPFGYTTNICSAASATATTCSTAALVLKSGRSLGSNRTFVPVGYAGPGSDGGAALLANAGQYNLVAPDDVSNGAKSLLLASPTVASATVDVRREFGSHVEAYANLSWLRNEGAFPLINAVPNAVTLAANAPNNPFTSAIRVRFPTPNLTALVKSTAETLRANGGVLVRMPHGWSMGIDYVWARSRALETYTTTGIGDPDGAGPGQSVTTAFQNGSLDLLRDINAFPLDYSPYLLASPSNFLGPLDTVINDATFRIAGPLVKLPAGNLTLTGLLEYRDETQRASYQESPTNAVYIPSRGQSAWSSYLEARLPLFSDANATWFARSLELQASVRYDAYRTYQPSPIQVTLPNRDAPLPDFSKTVNQISDTSFTLGLRYEPIKDITLRASYGTGFLPPSITQLADDGGFTLSGALVDPKRGGVSQATTRFQIASGNPNLLPENSTSWSAGVILTPQFLKGFRLSIDYTHIRKTNEIRTPTPQNILDLEDLLPGRVVRDPLEPNAPAGYTAGPIRSIDARLLNVAQTVVDAVDIQADYTIDSASLGKFHFYGVATWQPTLRRKFLPTSPFIDSVGYSGGILEWRGNAGLDWSKGPWSVGWNAQFYDSYLVYGALALPLTPAQQASRDQLVLDQGSARIPRQIYNDLYIRYRFGGDTAKASGALNGTELLLGIQNVFDAKPPIIATTASQGGYSTYGDPRLRRFTFSIRKHF